jgi:hypothetical protein
MLIKKGKLTNTDFQCMKHGAKLLGRLVEQRCFSNVPHPRSAAAD